MTTSLSKLRMGKNDDPEDLKDDIAAIENEYCCNIDGKTRKVFVVKTAGKYYADVIQHKTLRKGTGLTAEDLIEAMSETCRIAGGGDKENSDDKQLWRAKSQSTRLSRKEERTNTWKVYRHLQFMWQDWA